LFASYKKNRQEQDHKNGRQNLHWVLGAAVEGGGVGTGADTLALLAGGSP